MDLFASSQVKLYKSDNLDSPFQSVSLGQSLFFHFSPLPRDGEVRLASDIADRIWMELVWQFYAELL